MTEKSDTYSRSANQNALTRTVVFRREGMFYPIQVRENEDLAEHARLNPGTLAIEDTAGNVLWSPSLGEARS